MTDRQDAAADFIRSEQDTAHHAAKITDQLVDRWRDERTRYETGEQENPPRRSHEENRPTRPLRPGNARRQTPQHRFPRRADHPRNAPRHGHGDLTEPPTEETPTMNRTSRMGWGTPIQTLQNNVLAKAAHTPAIQSNL
jgi:hypothetical protein